MAASAMNDEDRADIVMRLVAMQEALRSVCQGAEQAARIADASGAPGLAVATFLMKESIEEYSKQLGRFVLGFDDDE